MRRPASRRRPSATPAGFVRGGVAAVVLLLAAGPLAAQSARVDRVGPESVAADAGSSVTAAFRVANSSRAPLPVAVSLPGGWTALAADATMAAPGATEVRLVAAAVPRGAAAGAYVLRVRAGAAADSVIVTVRERRGIVVAVDEAPRFAVVGAAYRARFRVTNRGNGRAAVRLALDGSPAFAAHLDRAALDLGPGESVAVDASVDTRETDAPAHRLTLRATGGGAPASASLRVPLVRRSARGGVGVQSLPATVAFRAASGVDGRGGVPAQVQAGGAVPGVGSVDLFYRGRGAASPEMGEQEQLSLSVRGRRGEVRLGDQLWGMSPLTSTGRPGYGAGARLNAGPAWAEGFSARDRFRVGAPRTTGAAVGVGSASTFLSANYFDAGDGGAAVASLHGRVQAAPGVAADAEAAEAGGARASYARVYASRGGALLDVRRIQADADFPGEQRGRSLLQASARVRLPLSLRATGGWQREVRVDTLGRVLAGTPLDASTAHLGLSLGRWLTVERREQTRAGVSSAGSFARRADSWTAYATLPTRPLTLSGGGEAGTVDDAVSGASRPFARAWLRAGVRAGPGSLSAGVERRAGMSVETGAERDAVTGSLQLQVQPAPDTRVSLLAQVGRPELGSQPDGMVDGTLEQRLPGGHAIRLRVRTFPWATTGRRAPLVLLDYVLPLRVPVARDRATGTISGRVVDEETGRPVADVLVRAGDRAVVTDGRGRWAVAGLPPGAYTVEVDPVSVGVGRVVVRPDALQVDVEGGREDAVEIGVSRAAKVEGRVLVADPESGDGGVDAAVVEVRHGSDRRRRVTDANGRFLFSDLPPGEWTVAVVSADLPPHHAFERDAQAVTLAPGQDAHVELRAVPRKREMVMVGGGDLVLGGAPVVGRAPGERPQRVAPGLLSTAPSPATQPPPSVAMPAAVPAVGATPSSASPVVVTVQPRGIDRPELRAENRPWRVAGASGLADWPNDTYETGDREEDLESIAWLVYRDGSLWPRIWLANRDVVPDPARVTPGTELVVPPPGPLTDAERAAGRAFGGRRGRMR